MRLRTAILLAHAQLRRRFSSTFSGFVYSFLKPLLLFAIYYVIFRTLFIVDRPDYLTYLLSGIVYWFFISDAASRSIGIVRQHSPLIEQFNVSGILVLLSSIIVSLVLFVPYVVILLFIVIATGGSIDILWLLFGLLLTLAAGMVLSLLLSAVSTIYRDTLHLWEPTSLMLFWSIPIVYYAEHLSGPLSWLAYNPLSVILATFRAGYGLSSAPDVLTLAVLVFFLSTVMPLLILWYRSISRRALDYL
jgi:ABC-type polysaccharide/polyol phosphate export permease